MLFNIFIIALIVLVVGVTIIGIGYLMDSDALPFIGAILLYPGVWTASITGILLLIKIAFPALGT